MAKRHLLRVGLPKRRRLRPLQFDTLEDRRLLAGLNILVFEDIDSSGGYEESVDTVLPGRVLFVDADQNGELDAEEAFAVSDENGQLAFGELGVGTHWLQFLGQNVPPIQVDIEHDSDELDLTLAALNDAANISPFWKQDSVNLEGTEDLALEIGSEVLRPLLEATESESIYYFVSKRSEFGEVAWSVSLGGSYAPAPDFFGEDSIEVMAYDGQSWSGSLAIEITVEGIDDLPTALRVQFAESIPENSPGAIIGTYTIDDVDGGQPQFYYSDANLIEAKDGVIRLAAGRQFNFEQVTQFSVNVRIDGDADHINELKQAATIAITNVNDASVAVEFSGIPQVTEFRKGHRFGSLRVIDEDRNEQFTWKVSDNRFIVDSGNNLRLSPNVFLATRDQLSIPLRVTATSVSGGDSITTQIAIQVQQASPSFQNQSMPLDVNNDGLVTGQDLLAVVNALNSRGASRDLGGPPPDGDYFFVDVNGDRVLSSLDLLVLVNHLTEQRRLRPRGNAEGGSNYGSTGGSSSPNNESASPMGSGSGEGESNPAPAAYPSQDNLDAVYATQSILDYQQRLKRSI